MNMLVQPAPLPEEMDRGYLGRIMRINGYRSPKDMVDAIAVHFGEEGWTRREVTTHELLSRMAGMTTEQFAQRHTTMPLRRGITSYFPDLIHGSEERKGLLCVSGTLRKYPVAFFCKECVKADLLFHGASYWRRDLQTPGQMWCPKHLTPLHFVSSADAFIESPAKFVDEQSQIPEDWIQPAIGNTHVQQFLELAAALYDRSTPLSVALIAPLLGGIGSANGFRSSAASKQGVLISDQVKKLFPERWLSAVFHEVVAKDPGEYLPQIDGVLYLRTAASSTIAYLLVLSVLFESADHAINAMVEACNRKEAPSSRPRRAQRRFPCVNELLGRYAEAKGVHAEVARQLGLPYHTVRRRLCELGLPSLPEFDLDSKFGVVAALRAFYLDKRSYSASFDIAGTTVECFDALLRQCGPKLITALDLMTQKSRARPRVRQAKGLLPPIQRDTAGGPATNQFRETLLQN